MINFQVRCQEAAIQSNTPAVQYHFKQIVVLVYLVTVAFITRFSKTAVAERGEAT